MHREVLPRSEVQRELKSYELVQVNAWLNRKLGDKFEIGPIPAFVVVDSKGKVLARLEGVHPAGAFTEFLKQSARMQ